MSHRHGSPPEMIKLCCRIVVCVLKSYSVALDKNHYQVGHYNILNYKFNHKKIDFAIILLLVDRLALQRPSNRLVTKFEPSHEKTNNLHEKTNNLHAKTKAQISCSYREADQCFCFRYSTLPLPLTSKF